MTETETLEDPDPLSAFAFQRGDRFLDSEGTEWAVNGCLWSFSVSYVPERDGWPDRADHRFYEIGNRDMEIQQVSEIDLISHFDAIEEETEVVEDG